MAIDFKFPDVGEGIAEGEIVKWRVKEGDQIKEHDVIADVETDKAIVEIPSPSSGTILKVYHKEGDTVKVGEPLASIGDASEKPPAAPAQSPIQKAGPIVKPAGAVGYLEEAPDTPLQENRVQPSLVASQESSIALPAVRRIARDLGVDLSKVRGTGAGGRVTEEDVRNFSVSTGKKAMEETMPRIEAKVQKKYDMWGYVSREPLKGVRRSIAKHMVESVSKAVHVTQMDEIDVTRLYSHKEREKKIAEVKGVKLTYMPFIIKACIAALKKYPYFNSMLDDEHEEIVLKKYYNIGMAVDTDDGLIVPVMKGADQKNIFAIAKEISELAEKARKRELDIGDMKGGTFTITNIGSLGGTYATPIINHPEVAILGVGRTLDRLTVDGQNRIKVRKIMPLSLSFDHRVVDGADAARFMNAVKERLEDPDLLMMEG